MDAKDIIHTYPSITGHRPCFAREVSLPEKQMEFYRKFEGNWI